MIVKGFGRLKDCNLFFCYCIKKCLQFLGNDVKDDYLFRQYCCNVREFGIKILSDDGVDTVRVGDYISRKGDEFTIHHKKGD